MSQHENDFTYSNENGLPHKPNEIHFECLRGTRKTLSTVQGSFILAKFLCKFQRKKMFPMYVVHVKEIYLYAFIISTWYFPFFPILFSLSLSLAGICRCRMIWSMKRIYMFVIVTAYAYELKPKFYVLHFCVEFVFVPIFLTLNISFDFENSNANFGMITRRMSNKKKHIHTQKRMKTVLKYPKRKMNNETHSEC